MIAMHRRLEGWMKISVRTRLVLWYIASITLLFIVMLNITYGIFSHAIYSSDVTARLDEILLEKAQRAGSNIALHSGPFALSAERYSSLFGRWIGYDVFLNPACGQLRDFPDSFGDEPLIIIRNSALEGKFIPLTQAAYANLSRGMHSIETIGNVFQYPLRVVTLLVRDREGHRYALQIGMSMQYVSTTLGNVLLKFFIWGPFLILIISLMGYLFVKASLKPVRDMVSFAREITAEDLSRRVPVVETDDEIGELSTTLNDMIARLEKSFEQVRQFSDDVSHELKTPLAVIRGEIEVALKAERSGDEYRATLASILEESQKLELIMENLLFLSRLDVKKTKICWSDIALDELLMEVFEELAPLGKERGIRFSLRKVDEVSIRADGGLMKRLLVNLIQNALKYTKEGGKVEVSLEDDSSAHGGVESETVLIVSDTGIGIPRIDLPHIFDRFYRVDKSRSGKTGGSGLGLTIVKKILDIHHGRIVVKSTVGSGSVFFVYLPKN